MREIVTTNITHVYFEPCVQSSIPKQHLAEEKEQQGDGELDDQNDDVDDEGG